MPLSAHHIAFDGALLKRGFWLYVWEIAHGAQRVYYVGRTGDSSSKHASSPFSRVGMHFDIRPNAKGNSLLRRLRDAELDPNDCTYEMLAVGPLFDEQNDFETHKPIRDIVATLEHELAKTLKARGFAVIGAHHAAAPLDEALFLEVMQLVEAKFFSNRAR